MSQIGKNKHFLLTYPNTEKMQLVFFYVEVGKTCFRFKRVPACLRRFTSCCFLDMHKIYACAKPRAQMSKHVCYGAQQFIG